jgi:hypothetical protein
MRRNVRSSLRRISSGGGVAHLAKAIGNTLHTVGPMSHRFLRKVINVMPQLSSEVRFYPHRVTFAGAMDGTCVVQAEFQC